MNVIGRGHTWLELELPALEGGVLLRKTEGESGWSQVGESNPARTRFRDQGLAPGRAYHYRIGRPAVAASGVKRAGEAAERIVVDLDGALVLELRTGDGGDGITRDHAAWGSPVLIRKDGKAVPLKKLIPRESNTGWGSAEFKALTIGARSFPDSLWEHAVGRVVFDLDGGYRRFEAWVGCSLPDGPCSVDFAVRAAPLGASPVLAARTLAPKRSPGRTSYYVDPEAGQDDRPGTSPERAWKSLERANTQVFAPGDRLRLRAGARFEGRLKPLGSGRAKEPIVLEPYGDGSRPKIEGQGLFEAALHLYNIEYWEVKGLEITNQGKERAKDRKGVFVEAKDFGTAHGIQLKDLHVHDVNGWIPKRQGGTAIAWKNGGSRVKTRFDGLLIEGCHIERCERNAIAGDGNWERSKWHPSLNVVIRRNLIEKVPGDGIVPIGCEGALVEHNIMRDCTDFEGIDAAAGMWPWSSDNTLFQYNEVSGHRNFADGQGFDADDNCRGTVFQYNYSHDNWGGFFLLCGTEEDGGTFDTVIRYNVSRNDGLHDHKERYGGGYAPPFVIWGKVLNSKIYNNVIYLDRKANAKSRRRVFYAHGSGTRDMLIANNIFVAPEPYGNEGLELVAGLVMANNLFSGEFSGFPEDPAAIRADPLFEGPMEPGREGLEAVKAFRLRKNSPAIAKGQSVEPEEATDPWGQAVGAKPSIGVHAAPRQQAAPPPFFDDFNGPGLDPSKWLVARTQWESGPGGDHNNGVVPENIRVAEGRLLLQGHGDRYRGPVMGVKRGPAGILPSGDGRRCGAAVATRHYYASGRYEVRAKVMPRLGACSAFWTYQFMQPAISHEIDIEVPGRPAEAHQGMDFKHALFNTWIGEGDGDHTVGYTRLPSTLGKGGGLDDGAFHTYRFDWHSGGAGVKPRVEWYVDDQPIRTIKTTVPFFKGRFWLGLWFPDGWAGAPDFENGQLEIDWVRITPFGESRDDWTDEDHPLAGLVEEKDWPAGLRSQGVDDGLE